MQFDTARFDLGQRQQFFDQLAQIMAGFDDVLQASLGRFTRRLGGKGTLHGIGVTDDDSQWRPQLVAHVGQKFRFQTIGLIETRVQITQLIDPKVQSLVHCAQIFTGTLGTFDNPVERFRQRFKLIARPAREPRVGLAIFKRLRCLQQAHDWR